MDREMAHPSYYRAEKKAYAKLDRIEVSLGHAAHVAAHLLEMLGEKPVRFVLGRVPRNWDRFNRTTRTIEFNPPCVPLLNVVHEVAHVLHWEHDENHATAVALVAAILEDILE